MSFRVKIALMLIRVAEKLILAKKLQEPKSKTNQFNVQFEFYLRKFHNSIPKVGIGNTQITVKYETEAQAGKAINEYISNCVKVFNDGDHYESRSFKITKITYAE